MGNYWRFETNPFWHHEWKEFDGERFVRIVSGLLAGAIAVQIGLASLFLLIKPDQYWVGSNFFVVALIFHCLARVQVEKQAPERTFVNDAQRGALDFLRMLPVSGHELVIARKLPLWFLRFFVAGLWSPIYAVALALLGLPAISAIPLSLLLGTVGWVETYALVAILFLPVAPDILLFILFLLATIWSSEGIQQLERRISERRTPFVAGWLALVTLGLFALQFSEVRRWHGAFDFFAPQPFYDKSLMPVWATLWVTAACGWVRVDRLARWLETPKGLRRFYFVPSLFILLFFPQGYLWGWMQQIRHWRPEDCFAATASFTFAFSGILHWLWFNWTWAERTPPEKPPAFWLPETFAWRITTASVPLLGCWFASLPLSKLDIAFFNVWLSLSAVDAFSLALSKSVTLRTVVQWRLKGFEFLSSFAFLPLMGFAFGSPLLVAFSPSTALLILGWQPLLASVNPLRVGGLFSVTVPSIPIWAAILIPSLRVVLLLVIWQIFKLPLISSQRNLLSASFLRALAFVNRAGEFVFILPAIERALLTRSQNPVFRHIVSVTRWRYSWLPYFVAFVVGFLKPPLSAALFVTFALTFVPVFWFTTYLTVHSYLRKLHQTGELWQWLITPVPSQTIVNGWRYGGWWWQLRWLALIMWLFVGGLLGGGIGKLLALWLFLTPVLVIIAALGTLIIAIMTIGAVPIAISDALREPQRAFSNQGHRWSRRKALGLSSLMALAVGASVGTCGFFWFLAPLVGLVTAITSVDPAARALDQIRKAPMDKLPT